MTIPYFAVALTDQQFTGNAAGVCVLSEWLPDGALQAIAIAHRNGGIASSDQ